ncbi:MAG TPA: folate-binding protein [Caulobacteraceae bacterium]|nr:folate-binding protein [Caulobacteraceae bacterium]
MAEGPLAAELKSRALVGVIGPDWRDFLQGLLSQDVETLGPGELRFGALLTPQGKLLFDLFILGRDDGCWLDVAADRREALIQRLTIYRLRAKVEIAAVEASVWAVWNGAAGGAPDPRLLALGRRAYGRTPGGAAITDEAAYNTMRLALGVPDAAKDAPDDYPIEANFDRLNGIDFQKGCFVGQETTSRMKRRGQIKSRMLPLVFEGAAPPFGAEVMAGALRAGEVRSGAEGRAMALLRLDRIAGAALSVDGRAVAVERPAYVD